MYCVDTVSTVSTVGTVNTVGTASTVDTVGTSVPNDIDRLSRWMYVETYMTLRRLLRQSKLVTHVE